MRINLIRVASTASSICWGQFIHIDVVQPDIQLRNEEIGWALGVLISRRYPCTCISAPLHFGKVEYEINRSTTIRFAYKANSRATIRDSLGRVLNVLNMNFHYFEHCTRKRNAVYPHC